MSTIFRIDSKGKKYNLGVKINSKKALEIAEAWNLEEVNGFKFEAVEL
jgi:hypothetical protein